MDASLRARLLDLLGPGGVADGDAVLPATPDQVGAVCRLCSETGTAMTVISGPDSAEVAVVRGILISLARMTNTTVDAEAGVAYAGAGTMLAALRTAARHEGLATIGRFGGGPGHVGSAIACGSIPPRALVGVDLVLSSGARVTAGGRTLKDVTGYDLTGLVLGSMGRLAVIVGASFRLVPENAVLPPSVAAGPSRAHPLFASVQASMDNLTRLDPVA